MTSRHGHFTTRLGLTAFIGTAIIVAAAPFIRPATLPPWLEEPSTWIRSQPALARAADALWATLFWSPAHTPTPATGHVPQSSTTPATTPTPTTPTDDTPQFPPFWGLVHSPKTATYTTTGKFLRNITAGAEVAITGVRDSTAGRMAECRVGTLASADDLVLIRSADLNVYPGALDTVSPIQISRYRLYAKLQGELQTVTKEKTSTERRDNPHWNAYQSTKANYDTYWQRVKELTENRDKASDDERMKWGDELRRLKGEDIRIGKAYEAARDQYKAWNAAHPTPVASSSPRAVALQKSLQSLRASLQEPATLP